MLKSLLKSCESIYKNNTIDAKMPVGCGGVIHHDQRLQVIETRLCDLLRQIHLSIRFLTSLIDRGERCIRVKRRLTIFLKSDQKMQEEQAVQPVNVI